MPRCYGVVYSRARKSGNREIFDMGNASERQLSRYRKRRQFAIEFLGGKCVVCGTTENLEIDHIDKRTKSFQITQKWSVPLDIYISELRKCQLLCHTHHKEKSDREKDWGGLYGPSDHGSLAYYKNRGCRCDKCRLAYSEHTAAYRLQKQIEEILKG